ncbi:MAG: hypothetical protein R2749_05455 [Acidimicrobiales bacterium]
MRLLVEIAAFLVAAFALGVGVGWLLWRSGRNPVPTPEWRRLRRQAEQLVAHVGELQQRAEQQEAGRRSAEEDARRTRVLLERAWAERQQLQARVELLEREALSARHERDQATERLGRLQRRLAELSVNRARSQGIVPGVLSAEHAPPDPTRIGLAAMPAPLAPPRPPVDLRDVPPPPRPGPPPTRPGPPPAPADRVVPPLSPRP